MTLSRLFSRRWWLVIPFGAVLFILATDVSRVRQVEQVRDLNRPAAAGTDRTAGRHWLVVPEHNNRSYQWLAETELMLTGGPWRIRQITYENTPGGREVHSASPYRWWLGLVAWADHQLTGRPIGESVEQAALWAGPLLHLLLLAGSCVMAARLFGPGPAALLSVGLAVLFPLAGEFLPGVPDDHGLGIICASWSVLFLVAGLQGHRLAFLLSGVAGGLGLWLSVAIQVPVLGGIGGGALLLAAYDRLAPGVKSPGVQATRPWPTWALAGALTGLLAYLAEYFPHHLAMRLEANHPVYGLAWLGLGQLLWLADGRQGDQPARKGRILVALLVAGGGLAALPVAMRLLDSPAFLVANPLATRLTNLPDGAIAPNLASWLVRDGPVLAKLAVILPLFLLVPAGLALLRRETPAAAGRPTLFLSGVLVLCLALACTQLQWCAMAQLVLLAWLMTALPLQERKTWLIAAGCCLPGFLLLAGTAFAPREHPTILEAEGLAERSIAHWIADHADEPGTGVLISPDRVPGFYFHGGLRGLGSPSWENQDGVAATVRILDATTSDEALALLNRHALTHLVLASWDTDLDEFVRWSMNNPNDAFLTALHRWALPPWLQPRAYRLPGIPGFEGQSVVILQVTENTDRALALSRLAEYFLEMQETELVNSTNEALLDFPANLAALIGRAQIEKARGEAPAFAQVLATIEQSLRNGLDRLLPWDRRVSLAVVLAQGNRPEPARAQLQLCLAGLDETRARALASGALYRLLVLSKTFNLPITQPGLRDLAVGLLPAELRARL